MGSAKRAFLLLFHTEVARSMNWMDVPSPNNAFFIWRRIVARSAWTRPDPSMVLHAAAMRDRPSQKILLEDQNPGDGLRSVACVVSIFKHSTKLRNVAPQLECGIQK